jgi:hypothetical protein
VSGRAHFFVTLISLASLLFILRLVRRRQLRAKYSLLWLTVGLGLVLLAASPRLLDRTSRLLGISYPPTTLFVIAITLLLLLVAHFSWELSRLEEKTRTLAEHIALLQARPKEGGLEGDGQDPQPDVPENLP